MKHRTDLKVAFLEGEVPDIGHSDSEYAWLLANVATPNGLTKADLWHQYLIEQGEPDGHRSDMIFTYLRGLGHLGAISDMLHDFWATVTPFPAGPSPTVTAGSFVKTLAGTNAVHTLSLPVSVLANRRWLIFNLAKDNRSTPTPVTGITFNGNSIGAGIVEIGSRQIAIEGSFSSQVQMWIVKDADGPGSAGNYDVVITTPQFAQGTHYCALEISGASQSDVMNAIQLYSSTADVSGGGTYSHSITTTVNNCLIIDAWSQSTSASPVITPLTGQVQVGVNMFNSSGGANISSFDKATAGAQVVGQTTDVFSQRQAGITISISS